MAVGKKPFNLGGSTLAPLSRLLCPTNFLRPVRSVLRPPTPTTSLVPILRQAIFKHLFGARSLSGRHSSLGMPETRLAHSNDPRMNPDPPVPSPRPDNLRSANPRRGTLIYQLKQNCHLLQIVSGCGMYTMKSYCLVDRYRRLPNAGTSSKHPYVSRRHSIELMHVHYDV